MAKARKKRRKLNHKLTAKLLSIAMISIAIVIFYNVGKKVYRLYGLKIQSDLVSEELTSLEDENASLVTTKTKLEDPNYVATYARGEYMFSKKDEKVFYLPSGDETESDETSQ